MVNMQVNLKKMADQVSVRRKCVKPLWIYRWYKCMTPQFSFLAAITVNVINVGGDEDFLIQPGEDIEMIATAVGKLLKRTP